MSKRKSLVCSRKIWRLEGIRGRGHEVLPPFSRKRDALLRARTEMRKYIKIGREHYLHDLNSGEPKPYADEYKAQFQEILDLLAAGTNNDIERALGCYRRLMLAKLRRMQLVEDKLITRKTPVPAKKTVTLFRWVWTVYIENAHHAVLDSFSFLRSVDAWRWIGDRLREWLPNDNGRRPGQFQDVETLLKVGTVEAIEEARDRRAEIFESDYKANRIWVESTKLYLGKVSK